jgi:beta-phosphoglucomutase
VSGFAGAIFDVDGVLVDSPHERAWRDGLQELMEGPWSDIAPQSGARAALEYFDVPDVDGRVDEYADRKQTMIIELIEAGEFHAFPDALRFIMAVKDMGIKVAAASSSKNAKLFLRQIRLDTFAEENGLSYDFLAPGLSLLDFFDADLSGRDFAQGKPHPEIFLTSAAELGLAPEDCFVIEDAVSGVQAAKAGGMAALGLARADDEDALAAADADLVVTSLDDVDLDGLRERTLRRKSA